MEESFEPGGVHLKMDEMESEEHAGLGFGVSVLLLVGFVAALKNRGKSTIRLSRLQWAIPGSTWFCLVVLMSKFGLTAIGRIIAPYYLLLIPVFLLPTGQEQVVRAKWWRFCGAGVFFLGALLLIISPARPLWPANFVLSKLDAKNSPNPKLRRVAEVFSTYAMRADALAPVRARLPEGLTLLGLVTGDDPETSLWRPFGSRRIEHVKKDDSLENLRARGIQYVLVNSSILYRPFNQWIEEMHGEIVWKITLQLKASVPPVDWYFVRVDARPPPAKSVMQQAQIDYEMD
jgi:hypothetical protein